MDSIMCLVVFLAFVALCVLILVFTDKEEREREEGLRSYRQYIRDNLFVASGRIEN